MAFALSSPVTGVTGLGLTSPTWTNAADTAPANARQFAVSALGGTQTGGTVHTISSPFTTTMFRPANFKVLGQPSPTGQIRAFPRNNFVHLTRKGVMVAANQPIQMFMARTVYTIPAGSETYDPVNVATALAFHEEVGKAYLQGIYDTIRTGTL